MPSINILRMNTNNSPYSTGVANKPVSSQLDIDSQIAKYKEDESTQKAPPILPHELDNIIAALGDTFISLTQLSQMLAVAAQNDEIDKLGINKIIDKVDNANQIVLAISEDLDILKV
tara:strand:- start:877 stop:1227 length:351 start_codon:yes stop_codon:yes gene_type:complete